MPHTETNLAIEKSLIFGGRSPSSEVSTITNIENHAGNIRFAFAAAKAGGTRQNQITFPVVGIGGSRFRVFNNFRR